MGGFGFRGFGLGVSTRAPAPETLEKPIQFRGSGREVEAVQIQGTIQGLGFRGLGV